VLILPPLTLPVAVNVPEVEIKPLDEYNFIFVLDTAKLTVVVLVAVKLATVELSNVAVDPVVLVIPETPVIDTFVIVTSSKVAEPVTSNVAVDNLSVVTLLVMFKFAADKFPDAVMLAVVVILPVAVIELDEVAPTNVVVPVTLN
jgi:hypothetical protein